MDQAVQKQAAAPAMFAMQWEGDKAEQYSRESMLEANRDSDDVCDFVRAARVGEEQTFGGGAAPICTLRRLS